MLIWFHCSMLVTQANYGTTVMQNVNHGWLQLIKPNTFLAAGVRSLDDMASRSSMPSFHSQQNAHLPASVSHHAAREDTVNRCTMYNNTESPTSASTSYGLSGFQSQSPSMPAHSSGGTLHFISTSAAGLHNSEVPTMQGSGPLASRILCSAPSGLSRDSTVTQVGQHSSSLEYPPTSHFAAQPFSPDQHQTNDYLLYSASWVSGGSRKRKALMAETPGSAQDLTNATITDTAYIGGIPAATAHILLPNLGRSGVQPQIMQPLQQVSAAEQMYNTLNSQPYAGSAIHDSSSSSTDEMPAFKRQRLSRSSGYRGSSSSAQMPHSSYFVPTPGQACDPHGLEEAKAPAWGNNLYFSTATSQLYYMGQVPKSMQTSPGPVMTPKAQFQAHPHAWPQMTPQLPSQAAPLEAPMASPPPQAPSQTTTQAPAANQGAQFQAGQVVWGRCYAGWWPAMVTPLAPPQHCPFLYKGMIPISTMQ